MEGYHCYLPVKQNLVATYPSKPYFNGHVLFAQNFIAICRFAKARGRLLVGEGASWLTTPPGESRGRLLVKNKLHGQVILNFEPLHGLPPARRMTSTTMSWRKTTRFLWVSSPRCPSARGGRADRGGLTSRQVAVLLLLIANG